MMKSKEKKLGLKGILYLHVIFNILYTYFYSNYISTWNNYCILHYYKNENPVFFLIMIVLSNLFVLNLLVLIINRLV